MEEAVIVAAGGTTAVAVGSGDKERIVGTESEGTETAETPPKVGNKLRGIIGINLIKSLTAQAGEVKEGAVEDDIGRSPGSGAALENGGGDAGTGIFAADVRPAVIGAFGNEV